MGNFITLYSCFVSAFMCCKVDIAERGGLLNLDIFFTLLCVAVGGSSVSTVYSVYRSFYLLGNAVSYRMTLNRLNTLVKYGYLDSVVGYNNSVRYSLSLHAEKMLFSNFDKKAFADLHAELQMIIKDNKKNNPPSRKKTVIKKAKK